MFYFIAYFVVFTYTGSRYHQLLTLSEIALVLYLHSLGSLPYLHHTYIYQHSLYPLKHQLCVGCTNNMLIPWQGLYKDYQFHGIQLLQLHLLEIFGVQHGHHAIILLQSPQMEV